MPAIKSTGKNRNFIEEIKSKQSRLFCDDRWDLIKSNFRLLSQSMSVIEMFNEQIEYLEKIYKNSFLMNYADDLNNYFPIRCVACIEGYLKLVYSYLIEYGNPFRENAKKFDKISFSIDTALSLETHSISLGDFIAHLLPAGGFEDINKSLSTLIDKDLIPLCRETYKTYPRQIGLFGDDESDFNTMLKVIQDMYKVRHILCHEVGYVETNIFASENRVYSPQTYIDETWTFLSLIERVIVGVAPPKETKSK